MGILSIFKKKKEEPVESNFDEALEAVKAGRATKNVCLVYGALRRLEGVSGCLENFHDREKIESLTGLPPRVISASMIALQKKQVADVIAVELDGKPCHIYRLSPDALQKDIDKLDADLEYYLEQEEKERWEYKK